MSDQYGVYKPGTRHRNLALARVSFTGVASGNPTVVSDETGVLVATGTKITGDGAGGYTLNLRDDYSGIHASPEVVSATDGRELKVESVSLTAGANAVKVRGEDAGVADDLTGDTCSVMLFMSLSEDF